MNYSYTVLDYTRSTQTFTIVVKTDDTSVTRPEVKFSFGYSEPTITEEKFHGIVKKKHIMDFLKASEEFGTIVMADLKILVRPPTKTTIKKEVKTHGESN